MHRYEVLKRLSGYPKHITGLQSWNPKESLCQKATAPIALTTPWHLLVRLRERWGVLRQLEADYGPCQGSLGVADGLWPDMLSGRHQVRVNRTPEFPLCDVRGSFLGYNFCSCRTRGKKEIVSKQPHCLSYKKSSFWFALYAFWWRGLMGSGLGKLIWLWACILNSGSSSLHVPEQHLLGAESWAGSKINRRPGPCSRGLERGTGKRCIV